MLFQFVCRAFSDVVAHRAHRHLKTPKPFNPIPGGGGGLGGPLQVFIVPWPNAARYAAHTW